MSEIKQGAPTKWKEEFCQDIIDFCGKGYSIEAFAGKCKVSKETLYQWFKQYPHFSDAKKQAIEQSRLFWEGMAIDNLISKTSTERDGNKAITNSTALNSTVWIFNMKNRFGWADRREIITEDKPTRLIIEKKK